VKEFLNRSVFDKDMDRSMMMFHDEAIIFLAQSVHCCTLVTRYWST